MIEKSFDKAYPIKINGIPQSTLTRAANRLLAEYAAAFGGWGGVPDEITAIAEQIKQGIDSEEYEYENTYDGGGIGNKVYDNVKYTNEARARAFWDTDEYNDPVYRVTWYFFATETYTKNIAGKTLRAGSYHDILKKVTTAKGKYRYFCTHRPPSRGIIPDGFVSYDTYGRDERYIGEVTYNEQPPAEALRNWGLVIDPDWERIRAAYVDIK